MTDTRRLSAEIRKELLGRASELQELRAVGFLTGKTYQFHPHHVDRFHEWQNSSFSVVLDALHDLDVADRERDEWQELLAKAEDKITYHKGWADSLYQRCQTKEEQLTEARATIAQQASVIAVMRDVMVNQHHVLWDKALEDTDETALVFVARIQAEARAKVLEEAKREWLRLDPDGWAKWLEAQLAAPPEEAGDG